MANTIFETVMARRMAMNEKKPQERFDYSNFKSLAAKPELQQQISQPVKNKVTQATLARDTDMRLQKKIQQKQAEETIAKNRAQFALNTLPEVGTTGTAMDIKRRAVETMNDRFAQNKIDEDELLKLAKEDPAKLAETLRRTYEQNNRMDELYKEVYPNSGVINTAKGMGKGAVIGATKQAPAGLMGAATAAHEGLGTFWNMITTPVQNGEINYEDYISPLRDDAQRMKAEADRLSAENLAGRAPGAQRLVGVSQAAGNMAVMGGIGGALGGVTGLAGLATAAVGAGAGGSAYIDAVTQGAGVDEAMAYGALVGATEAFTERLFGGNPLLDTKPGLVNQLIKKIGGSDKLMRYLASKPVEMVNEGMEEAVATIMEPVFQRLTYDPNASMATLEEIMDSAIDGVLLSGMLQGGAAAINSAKNIGAKSPANAATEPATTEANIPAEAGGNIFPEGTEAEAEREGKPTVDSVKAEWERRKAELDARAQAAREQGDTSAETWQSIMEETEALENDRVQIEQAERIDKKQVSSGFNSETNHIDRRTMANVGKQNVKAFQFDHPQLHRYFVTAAEALKVDAQRAIETNLSVKGKGTTYESTEQLKNAMSQGITREDIIKACDAIINNHGQENYAAAKRVELVLDQMLSEGYTSRDGSYEPDAEYIAAKEQIGGAIKGDSWEKYRKDNELSIIAGDITEENLRKEWEAQQTTPEGMGAASYGFDPFSNLANKYGTIPEGENPARVVDVPKQTADDKYVRYSGRSFMEAGVTPDEVADYLSDAIARGELSYDRLSNDAITQEAVNAFEKDGFALAYKNWSDKMRSGKTTAQDMAMGYVLYADAAQRAAIESKNGETDGPAMRESMDILMTIVEEETNSAQKVQAQRILKRLSPGWKLIAVRRTVDKVNEVNKGKKDEIKLDEKLAAEYLAAEDDTARDAVLDKIAKSIADQLPPSIWERLRAWRYVSMLGNLKTQSKNVLGNTAHAAARLVKNTMNGAIEAAAEKAGVKMERTRSVLLPNANDIALVRTAASLFNTYSDMIMDGGKYTDYTSGKADSVNTQIRKAREKAIFDGRNGLEHFALTLPRWYRNATNALMDKGDVVFAKPAFTGALASWLKANKFTAEDIASGKISSETMDKAIAFAVQEAQEAIFRDQTTLAKWLSGLRFKEGKTAKEKVATATGNAALDANLAFRRTPANVATRMYEYAPVNLVNVGAALYDLKQENITANEFIDTISKTTTGTALLGLGVYLAKAGILHASSGDDEKEAQFNAMQGQQPYSIDVNGRNYTLEWISPMSVPLFVGAELWQQLLDRENGESGMTLSGALEAAKGLFAPMEEMSMISGIADTLGSLEEDNLVGSFAENSIKNMVSQHLPTVLGQIERVLEGGERRQTYVDRNSEWWNSAQRGWATVLNKVPGENNEYNQIPYIDAWGRREKTGDMATTAGENFVLPWYSKKLNTTEVDEQLQELYDKGYKDVLPKEADKATTYKDKDGKDVYLTQDEYVEYAEKRGQKGYDLIETALGNNRLSDAQTARVIDKLYDFANQYGKAEATKFGPDSWVDKYFNKSDGKIVDKAIYMTEMTELKKQAGGTLEYDRKLIDHMLNLGVDEDVLLESASDPKTDKLRKGYNEVGEAAGFSVADWIDLYKNVDGNKKDEVKQYARDMGLDEKQFETLWKYYYPPKKK